MTRVVIIKAPLRYINSNYFVEQTRQRVVNSFDSRVDTHRKKMRISNERADGRQRSNCLLYTSDAADE